MIINSGIATLVVWFKLVLQGSELLTMGMASGNWVGLDSLERVPWDPWGPVTVFFCTPDTMQLYHLYYFPLGSGLCLFRALGEQRPLPTVNEKALKFPSRVFHYG